MLKTNYDGRNDTLLDAERFSRDGAKRNHGKNGLLGAHSEHIPSPKKKKEYSPVSNPMLHGGYSL